jgi:hypothetical protein
LTGDRTAGAVIIPPATVVVGEGAGSDEDPDDLSSGSGEQVPEILSDRWSTDGMNGVRDGVETILNVGIEQARVIDSTQWESLVAPVGDLVFTSSDTVTAEVATDGSVTNNGSTVTFQAGEIVLRPDQVGPFLAATAGAESDLNRMGRQQRFWVAWLEAVGANLQNPGVVPGESNSGLGLFVRTMAVSQIELVTLPVRTVTAPGTGDTTFLPAVEQVNTMVATLIPYPVGAAPDSRLRVRILDGTGELDNGLPAVGRLVQAGAEVATVGNATNFDFSVTQFIVAESGDLARATRLRDSLGVGEVVNSAEQASAVDVTVVLGRDALAILGGKALLEKEPDGG